ncbi:MAG: aspartate dehydrogenase [Rhodobiaceae bacterium]|nr:aspartate dehydrogenase [Rhodobiaceae bacterium]MCC0017396.1 aspartate dehydrogenase [Rhodobiaceae bacterium]MCC0041139.1 aspartate dehydrogenase [Rhodobiaceae bacterium]
MKLALIGHGGIATYAATQWQEDAGISVAAVICRRGREAAASEAISAAHGMPVPAVADAADLPDGIALAVDCGGHAALMAHGPALLRAGTDVVSVASGVLATPEHAEALDAAARQGGARLRFVSGAIGAVDAVAAAAVGGLERLTYIGRKAPAGWRGSAAEEVLDLDALSEAAVHFQGSAREAARRYPKNANVAATIAFAGAGLDETQVTLIADPAMTSNRHEVVAEGAFGRLHFVIDGNTLSSNPRSSALTAMSVVAHVRQRLQRTSVCG